MDYFTDMSSWDAENKAFLAKISEVEAKPTKSKKDEE